MTDRDQTVPGGRARPVSRRRMVQGMFVGASALWVAPALETFTAAPAAASAMGCAVCGTQVLLGGEGTPANLTAWSPVAGTTQWTSTGSVFEATGDSRALNRRQQLIAFSTACRNRFAVAAPAQPQVTLTLGGRLRGNLFNTDPSVLRVEFLSATGVALATSQLVSSSGNLPAAPATAVVNLPQHTVSLRVTLDLYGSFFDLNPGQAANLTLTLSGC